jgi:energy-coupling factor transport system ATP-binding protein
MQIEISNVRFVYPSGVEALRGVSFSVPAGQMLAIVGQNGAGKTTLVKQLNGLLKPSSGTIMIGDLDTSKSTIAKLSARVGYVFQNPDDQLFKRTVADEIAVGPTNLGFSKEDTERYVKRAVELMELEDKLETNPYDLTPTWRKRVAIAAVLAMNTPIVVLDEPTTGQDHRNINYLGRVMQQLASEGKTIVAISHDIDFVADYFERVIAMSQGQVLLDGACDEVFAQEELLAQSYVEAPQLTRLGKRLGFAKTVSREESFLAALREARARS